MGPQERRSERHDTDRPRVPYRGKKTLRSVLTLRRIGNWMCTLGIVLFLACPYLYHAFVVWCSGEPGEGLYTVTGPIAIFFIAFWLYNKGDELRGV